MQRLQGFQFELMSTGEQQRQMRRFSGSCRFVFNEALALQKQRYEKGEKKLGYAGLCRLLTEWRNDPETSWLAAAPAHPLQQKLKEPHLPALRSCVGGQPTDASPIRVRRMRVRGTRGSGRSDQYSQGGIRPLRL